MLPPFGQKRLLRGLIMGRMIRFQMAGNPLMKGAIFIRKGRDHILIGSSMVLFGRMIGGAVRAFRKLLRDQLIPLRADRLKVMPFFLHEDSPLHPSFEESSSIFCIRPIFTPLSCRFLLEGKESGSGLRRLKERDPNKPNEGLPLNLHVGAKYPLPPSSTVSPNPGVGSAAV